jgi:hypothetical protein
LIPAGVDVAIPEVPFCVPEDCVDWPVCCQKGISFTGLVLTAAVSSFLQEITTIEIAIRVK